MKQPVPHVDWPEYLKRFTRLMVSHPQAKLEDSVTEGQIQSKLWLVNQVDALQLKLGTVYLLAGWTSSLAFILLEHERIGPTIEKIRSFDIDPMCAKFSDELVRKYIPNWRFKASTLDIHDIDYEGNFTYKTARFDGSEVELRGENPDTIINTSCEHIADFNVWYNKIPQGKLCILQSTNNTVAEGHINPMPSLKDFKQLVPMSAVLYEGTLELSEYERYMIIGWK